jgi:hypothetical protein
MALGHWFDPACTTNVMAQQPFTRGWPRCDHALTVSRIRTYVRAMAIQYEAQCVCGATWRVYREEVEEDPMSTCIACGADTFDLTFEGENRASW